MAKKKNGINPANLPIRSKLGPDSVSVFIVCPDRKSHIKINMNICKYYSQRETEGHEGCYGCIEWEKEGNRVYSGRPPHKEEV